LFLAGATAGFLFTGCSATAGDAPVGQVCLDNTQKATLMAAAEDVLVRMQFVIEKYDLEKGVITTKPLRAPQFFEFWRSDNASAKNTAEANIHSIRRIVELNTFGADGKICLKCEVQIKRLSIPPQEIESVSRASSMFTGGNTSLQRLKLETDEITWIDLGSDIELQNKILKLVQRKIKQD
jgi:hypothetical protein